MIAALFVETGGCYFGLPDVDPWDVHRNARLYAAPWPVVAHPPCERWGRCWGGGPSARERKKLGDDGGCFAAALAAVRKWGGVLEHPEGSHAWAHFGLARPHWRRGWRAADEYGYTCCVAQGNYGHRARKLTWLYACKVDRPELDWSIPVLERLDEGFHSQDERNERRAAGQRPRNRLSRAENLATPLPFRDLLLGIARTTRADRSAA